DWTSTEDRKQRKKIQNRINQRAHRKRISEIKAQNPKSGQRPYRVDRWRVANNKVSQPNDNISTSMNELANQTPFRQNIGSVIEFAPVSGHSHQRSGVAAISAQSDKSPQIQFPLPSDHLLHLIHYNVFRALVSNKDVLRNFATIITSNDDVDNPQRGRRLCDGPTVIHPLYPGPPSSLFPTSLQMVHPHSNWIDMFPFPQIRDNLIQCEAYVDVVDFLKDLFGDMVNDNLSITPETSGSFSTSAKILIQGEDDDMVTAGRKGLIVWGEAHLKESWEATPGFLKKWACLLKGCEELIEISNRWRTIRGENPIVLAN
ncbi:hypothetical protein N7522_005049, partial [Penicillium canescens]